MHSDVYVCTFIYIVTIAKFHVCMASSILIYNGHSVYIFKTRCTRGLHQNILLIWSFTWLMTDLRTKWVSSRGLSRTRGFCPATGSAPVKNVFVLVSHHFSIFHELAKHKLFCACILNFWTKPCMHVHVYHLYESKGAPH